MSVFQNFKMPQGPADKRQLYLAGAGIALAVVGIVAFASWTNKPAEKKPKTTTATAQANSPDQAEREYSGILDKAQEDYRKERANHDRLMKQAEWERQHPGQAPPAQGAYAEQGRAAAPAPPPNPEEVKRHDTIHASNIALSFRDGSPVQKPADMKEDLAQQVAKLKEEIGQNINDTEAMQKPYPIYRDVAPQPQGPAYQYAEPKKQGEPAELTAATGPMYRVFEGTIIDSVLTNRLNGSFAGPVDVMTTEPVWSHDRNHILIPKGTRVIGEVKQVSTTGQKRLAMVFRRVIMPDGFSVNLDDVPGLDQQGATGIQDKVDNHWKSIFGTSVALGLISGFSLYGTQGALAAGGIDQYRQGVSQSVGQSSNRILETRLNQMPNITILEGHPIKIWISKDLLLPAYDGHRLRGDL